MLCPFCREVPLVQLFVSEVGRTVNRRGRVGGSPGGLDYTPHSCSVRSPGPGVPGHLPVCRGPTSSRRRAVRTFLRPKKGTEEISGLETEKRSEVRVVVAGPDEGRLVRLLLLSTGAPRPEGSRHVSGEIVATLVVAETPVSRLDVKGTPGVPPRVEGKVGVLLIGLPLILRVTGGRGVVGLPRLGPRSAEGPVLLRPRETSVEPGVSGEGAASRPTTPVTRSPLVETVLWVVRGRGPG